jgi:hypothetical protein
MKPQTPFNAALSLFTHLEQAAGIPRQEARSQARRVLALLKHNGLQITRI